MITTEACLRVLGGEASGPEVAALTDFAKVRWADYQVLVAYAWQGLAGVLEVTDEETQNFVAVPLGNGVGPARRKKRVETNLELLNSSMERGAYAELRATGAERYADAVLRLDEFLLEGGYRERGPRDEYPLYWGPDGGDDA